MLNMVQILQKAMIAQDDCSTPYASGYYRSLRICLGLEDCITCITDNDIANIKVMSESTIRDIVMPVLENISMSTHDKTKLSSVKGRIQAYKDILGDN